MGLMGDPALRIHAVEPPRKLAGSSSSGAINLTWAASTELGLQGYHVYRAASAAGPFTKLTASPLAGTSYTDSAVTSGSTYTYLVRTLKLESVPSGSYYNLSVGSTITLAANASGSSAPSNPSELTIGSQVSSASAVLSWQDNSSNETGFRIERKTNAGGTFATIATPAANATTYTEQAFLVLDKSKTEVVFNGSWFKEMNFLDVIRLKSRVTLNQMMQREDFKNRFGQGHEIRLHELQYPIMQGWDSVMVRADVELGGTDQLFNIMVGRDLQREEGQPQQVAMTMPILEGLDGRQKMSKSLGNYVALNESPGDMFGKIMSISDELMARYYEILLREAIPAGSHPMDAKKTLARRITARFHDPAAAAHALEEFNKRFSARDLDSAELPEYAPTAARDFVSLVVEAFALGFQVTRSRSDARRLIEGGSVQWRGEKVSDAKAVLPPGEVGVLKLDKTRAVRIRA